MTSVVSIRRLGLLLLCSLAVVVTPVRAATTIHVLISGLNCGGTYKFAPGAFDAMTFSFGATNPNSSQASAGGRSDAQAQFGDVVLVKAFDQCSPKLFGMVASGQHVATVTIQWDRTSGDPLALMKITLEQCIVKSVSYGAAQESVSFDWNRITFEYQITDEKGVPGAKVVATWDRAAGHA